MERLPNGLVVALEERDFPGVAFQLLVPAGAVNDPEGMEGAAALLEGWLWKGAGDLDARALAQALDRAQAGALSVLPRLVEGDEARVVYSAARRLTKREPVDLVALRRQAAEAVLEAGGYPIPR